MSPQSHIQNSKSKDRFFFIQINSQDFLHYPYFINIFPLVQIRLVSKIVMHSINDCETQSLYKQFLAYIKGNDAGSLESRVQVQYKKLFSQLHKSNSIKRSKLGSVETKQFNMRSSGCKFTRLEGYRQFNTMKDQFIKLESRIAFDNDHEEVEDKILIEQCQKRQLQAQIDNYKKQISLKNKNISQVKNQIKLIDLQQNKFTEAQQLANNILQFTEQFAIVNQKNFSKMTKEHEQILNKLKVMKNKAKSQLHESEFYYHIQKKDQQSKFKKLIKTAAPIQEDNIKHKKNNKIPRCLKIFMSQIEEVLLMLSEKQDNFQKIKLQQCTRLPTNKINLSLLAGERIQWERRVEQFQKKFELRLESSDRIIIKLFNQIKQSNEGQEKQIFKIKCLIEDFQIEYKQLEMKRIHEEQFRYSSQQYDSELGSLKSEDKMLAYARRNSIIFVKLLELVNSLLMKFRYIFKLFIIMNIDKRKLNDHLLRLDEHLDKKGKFISVETPDNSQPNQSNSGQDTNAIEICQLLSSKFQNVKYSQIQQFLFLFFNDFRLNLNCRKAMILEQLQDHNQMETLNDLIKVLQSIKDESEYNYNEKLKTSLNLLLDCFRSSVKPSSINSCRSYLSTPDYRNNLLAGELSLPSGMFPKVKYEEKIMQQEINEESQMKTKWIMEMFANSSQKDKPQQWGEQDKKNPSMMIRKLLNIRNQTTRKFKILDLHESEKKYIKNEVTQEQYHGRQRQKQKQPYNQNQDPKKKEKDQLDSKFSRNLKLKVGMRGSSGERQKQSINIRPKVKIGSALQQNNFFN